MKLDKIWDKYFFRECQSRLILLRTSQLDFFAKFNAAEILRPALRRIFCVFISRLLSRSVGCVTLRRQDDDDDDERLNWSDSIEIRRQKKRRIDSGDVFTQNERHSFKTSDKLMMEKFDGRHNICSKNIDSSRNRNLWQRNYLTISWFGNTTKHLRNFFVDLPLVIFCANSIVFAKAH